MAGERIQQLLKEGSNEETNGTTDSLEILNKQLMLKLKQEKSQRAQERERYQKLHKTPCLFLVIFCNYFIIIYSANYERTQLSKSVKELQTECNSMRENNSTLLKEKENLQNRLEAAYSGTDPEEMTQNIAG